jgi:hypothetical protein
MRIVALFTHDWLYGKERRKKRRERERERKRNII